MKAYRGSRIIAPLIPNIGSSWLAGSPGRFACVKEPAVPFEEGAGWTFRRRELQTVIV
jgi:hypothetical protein